MKVKNIVKQTKEYERLQGLISNIESALKSLKEINSAGDGTDSISVVNGGICISGYTLTLSYGDSQPKSKHVSPTLNDQVTFLIKDKLIKILEKQLEALKEEQSELEV